MFGGCLSPPLGRAVDILPRGGQTIEKRGEVFAGPRWWLTVAVAYRCQLLLRIPDSLEQRYRVERCKLLAQLLFELFPNQRRASADTG